MTSIHFCDDYEDVHDPWAPMARDARQTTTTDSCREAVVTLLANTRPWCLMTILLRKVSLEKSAEASQELDRQRDVYRDFARAGSTLFFLVEAMQVRNVDGDVVQRHSSTILRCTVNR